MPKRNARKLKLDTEDVEDASDVQVTGKRRQREDEPSPQQTKKKQNTSKRQTPALRRSRKRSLEDNETGETTQPIPSSKRKKKTGAVVEKPATSANTRRAARAEQRASKTATIASAKIAKPTQQKAKPVGSAQGENSTRRPITEASRVDAREDSTGAPDQKPQDEVKLVSGSHAKRPNLKESKRKASPREGKKLGTSGRRVARQNKLEKGGSIETLYFHVHTIGILIVCLLLLQHPSFRSSTLPSQSVSCFHGEPCVFNRELVEQVSLEFVRSTLSDLKQTLQEQSVLIKQRRRAIGAQTRVISEPLDELDDILAQPDRASQLTAIQNSKFAALRRLHGRMITSEQDDSAPALSERISTFFDQVVVIEDDLSDDHDPEHCSELREAMDGLATRFNSGNGPALGKKELVAILREEVEKDFAEEKDVALVSGGAQVVDTLTSVFPHETSLEPSVVLTPTSPVRNCFAFKGVYGNLTVRLPFHSTLGAGELQHGTVELSPLHSPLVAPKTVDLFGLQLDQRNSIIFEEPLGRLRHPITKFRKRIRISSMTRFNAVRFSFIENHGEKQYTCVHRVRIIAT